ncbi:ABC transporter substrate-binding protein [Maritalea sp.]|jgi:peptide/nickel transport system substrate-binding protein|uniref:ABC transporter substrate-binding protein n=1 Tax=Maritalea sp. TaxID=2003361 RepID=UPI0039E63DF7
MNKLAIRLAVIAMCGTSIGGAALAEETLLRMLPRHTDAHVQNFNPYNYGGPSAYVQDFAYEPLWIYNIFHPEKPFPALATSYDVADDLMSVTYHLREGVKWSDGEAFTADDVVFTFNYDKANPEFPIGYDIFDAANDSGNIVSVEALDDLTVRFNLDHADSLAHLTIGTVYPLPEHIWSSVEDPRNYDNKSVVGTGPWTEVTDFSRSSYKLCRNQYFRGDAENKIDCLLYPQLSGNEQVIAALSRGDLDWSGDGMTDPEITFTPKSEYNNYWLPAAGNTNLQLNTTKAPFNNLEFRKAMSQAIDRQTILEISTFGLTTESKYPIGTGEFYAGWYNEEELAPYKYLMEYNPEAAAKRLDDAGFVDADGDGWRDNPDGTAIDFKMSVPSGWTDWVNTLQTVSENLQDIGVNANLHTPEEGSWFDTIPTGDYDVFIMWVESYTTPWRTYKGMFNPRSMVPGQIREPAMHQMRIPAIEEALEVVAATSDEAVQRAKIQEVELLVAQNLPVISLFANPSWYQYSTRRFEGWVSKDNPYVRPMLHQGTPERVIHALSLKPVN